ncbi:hypothetical protein GGX14DRAFT_637694 [Mycena pura]|uniref:Uncharacterized protein n=1 Tax=Mycena pura TaxID=153505 RepID=A0AAD6VGS3_9AGAR|nr:hypothetical protein GGX14DRAFT_637694 [Mycena pura]
MSRGILTLRRRRLDMRDTMCAFAHTSYTTCNGRLRLLNVAGRLLEYRGLSQRLNAMPLKSPWRAEMEWRRVSGEERCGWVLPRPVYALKRPLRGCVKGDDYAAPPNPRLWGTAPTFTSARGRMAHTAMARYNWILGAPYCSSRSTRRLRLLDNDPATLVIGSHLLAINLARKRKKDNPEGNAVVLGIEENFHGRMIGVIRYDPRRIYALPWPRIYLLDRRGPPYGRARASIPNEGRIYYAHVVRRREQRQILKRPPPLAERVQLVHEPHAPDDAVTTPRRGRSPTSPAATTAYADPTRADYLTVYDPMQATLNDSTSAALDAELATQRRRDRPGLLFALARGRQRRPALAEHPLHELPVHVPLYGASNRTTVPVMFIDTGLQWFGRVERVAAAPVHRAARARTQLEWTRIARLRYYLVRATRAPATRTLPPTHEQPLGVEFPGTTFTDEVLPSWVGYRSPRTRLAARSPRPPRGTFSLVPAGQFVVGAVAPSKEYVHFVCAPIDSGVQSDYFQVVELEHLSRHRLCFCRSAGAALRASSLT